MRARSNRALRCALAVAAVCGATAGAEVIGGKPVGGGGAGGAGGGGGPVEAWIACGGAKGAKACAGQRQAAVTQLAGDLKALGTAGNFAPLPLLTKALKSPEPELRAAAAEGVGLLGPTPAETAALLTAYNDPVPAVRAAARSALGASGDDVARGLSGRAVGYQTWKSFEAEKEPDLTKLRVAPYAGAATLRYATSIQQGTALAVTSDAPEKVVAFFAAKAKRPALSLEQFEAAYSAEPKEPEASPDGMPTAEQMAQAMAMMQQMNEALNSGKSMQEVGAEMSGASLSASAAASDYADAAIYQAPKVVVLEETELMGAKRPARYVVVFGDRMLGKTGIAYHAPAVMP